jgi:small ligand-binding sensory domain FIST
MAFAAAISTHPVPATATGEVAGQVLETLGAHADVAFCFVAPAHAGALEDIGATIRALLQPTLLVGCCSSGVIANATEVETGPGLALWAGMTGPVAPLRVAGSALDLDPLATPPTVEPGRLVDPEASAERPFPAEGVVVLGDPFTFPAGPWLEAMARHAPDLAVVGGLAAGARGPGGSRLLLDDQVVSDGAVGAVLGRGSGFRAVVSQGCRPIGHPFVVTASTGSLIRELGGQPALSRLVEIARHQMPADQVHLINEGLQLSIVVDETSPEPGPGDVVVRPVAGADPATGAIAVGAAVEVGTTVQFCVRDPDAADADLHAVLASRRADGALLFACNGRGADLFHGPNHDAETAGEELGFPPLAGIFAAGEIGPAGGRTHVHAQTATLALFDDLGATGR